MRFGVRPRLVGRLSEAEGGGGGLRPHHPSIRFSNIAVMPLEPIPNKAEDRHTALCATGTDKRRGPGNTS
jgi:hypothetical protein